MSKKFQILIAIYAILTATPTFADEKTIISRFFEVSEVPYVGGGDADVYSKKGRVTNVEVTTSNLAINAGGRSASITVNYSIKEGSKDYTHLEWSGRIRIKAPGGYKIRRIGTGRSDAQFTKSFHGENHRWNNVTNEVDGSYFSKLKVKFDGKGDDDSGNARMKANIEIPVILRKL